MKFLIPLLFVTLFTGCEEEQQPPQSSVKFKTETLKGDYLGHHIQSGDQFYLRFLPNYFIEDLDLELDLMLSSLSDLHYVYKFTETYKDGVYVADEISVASIGFDAEGNLVYGEEMIFDVTFSTLDSGIVSEFTTGFDDVTHFVKL